MSAVTLFYNWSSDGVEKVLAGKVDRSEWQRGNEWLYVSIGPASSSLLP